MTEKNIIDRLIAREIRVEDAEEVAALAKLGFGPSDVAFKQKHYENHVEIFPEGQICIELDGKIIGACSSLIVNFDEFGVDHSFDDIAVDGYIHTHNPNGKNLYGIDVVVHPDYRKLKVGQRLYVERRRICRENNLESIVIGGRIPNYHKYADELTAKEYVDKVVAGDIYDPVLRFQLKNDFVVKDVKEKYLIDDVESLEYATIMEWKNDAYQG